MKKFTFSLSLLFITFVAVIVHSALLSNSDAPDAGLTSINTLAFGLLFSGLGLLLDLYFIFTNSANPTIKNRKSFWKIVGGLIVFGIVWLVYYSLST
jgi:uncharacterized membrane-anchored protein